MNLHAALVHVTSVSSVLHRMRLNKTSLLNSYSSFMFNCLFDENIGCNSQCNSVEFTYTVKNSIF